MTRRIIAPLAALLLLLATAPLAAQSGEPSRSDHDELDADRDSSVMWAAEVGKGWRSEVRLWSAYQFIEADDETMVDFIWSEVTHNGLSVNLANWQRDEVMRELTIDSLDRLSRTKSISIGAGDTISFYRQFRWTARSDHFQRVDNFTAADTISYRFTLRRQSDDRMIAEIDQIGVYPQSDRGFPSFFGPLSSMELITWVAPEDLTERTDVYVDLEIEGSLRPDRTLTRRDNVVGTLSEAVTDPVKRSHFAIYRGSEGD